MNRPTVADLDPIARSMQCRRPACTVSSSTAFRHPVFALWTLTLGLDSSPRRVSLVDVGKACETIETGPGDSQDPVAEFSRGFTALEGSSAVARRRGASPRRFRRPRLFALSARLGFASTPTLVSPPQPLDRSSLVT